MLLIWFTLLIFTLVGSVAAHAYVTKEEDERVTSDRVSKTRGWLTAEYFRFLQPGSLGRSYFVDVKCIDFCYLDFPLAVV